MYLLVGILAYFTEFSFTTDIIIYILFAVIIFLQFFLIILLKINHELKNISIN